MNETGADTPLTKPLPLPTEPLPLLTKPLPLLTKPLPAGADTPAVVEFIVEKEKSKEKEELAQVCLHTYVLWPGGWAVGGDGLHA